MGPNSSRFKAAFRKLLLRKPLPRHLIDSNQPMQQHTNGKMFPNQHLVNSTTPGLSFNAKLTANVINQRTSSVHTRLSRTTSNKSYQTKDDFSTNKFKRNKTLNCSLREINNNTID